MQEFTANELLVRLLVNFYVIYFYLQNSEQWIKLSIEQVE